MLDKSIYVHLDDAETTTISFVGGYFNPTKGFIVMSIDSELKVIISNVNQAMDILAAAHAAYDILLAKEFVTSS